MENLLPCPFCGVEAEIFDYDPEKEVGFHEPYTVQCSNECCCLGKDFRTREEAAEAWNRRAQQKQPNEPLTLEELRGMDGEKIHIRYIGHCKNFYEDETVLYYGKNEQYIQHYNGMLRACDLPLQYYGEDWLAYRRKPESEVSPVTNFDCVTASPESLNQCDFCTNPMKNFAGPVAGCDGNCQFEDGVPPNITNSGPAAPSENWEAQVIRDLARQGVSYQDTQAALDIIRQLKQKEKKGENHGERIQPRKQRIDSCMPLLRPGHSGARGGGVIRFPGGR